MGKHGRPIETKEEKKGKSMRKQDEIIRFSNRYLWAGVAVILVLTFSYMIRMTPLISRFWINFITALIMENAFFLLIIAALLIALHIIRLKMFKRDIEKERVGHGGQ